MDYKSQFPTSNLTTLTKPRLIIHGGAGNITPSNLPPAEYRAYHSALLQTLSRTHAYLISPSSFSSDSQSGHNALDTVSFAVSLLEDIPLFNSGHGAVFTREGVNELEASLMVSSGKKKRGVGVMGLTCVRNPIKLAREMLLRGERDLEGGNGESRGPMGAEDEFASAPPSHGAQGHCQLHGAGAEKLARQWGLEIVPPSYFFVQKRWDEHVRGLEREKDGMGKRVDGKGMATWDRDEFVPQGTCGAVALDAMGVVAVATSTGGMTNKLNGRIGDTPTLGAGFWAESWEEEIRSQGSMLELAGALKGVVADCLPRFGRGLPYRLLWNWEEEEDVRRGGTVTRATAISGTGNGDSFLRTNAVRTASAIARYRPLTSLADSIDEVSGPGGELEKSAGNRWTKTGEGEGGMVGIESRVVRGPDGVVNRKETGGEVVIAYNCGGMFRAFITRNGKAVCRIWKEGEYDYENMGYEGEGTEYDPRLWVGEKGV